MSVTIDVSKVIQILLPDGDWRNVADFRVVGKSQEADFPWRFTGMAQGKDVHMEGAIATWIDGGDHPKGEQYACPVASIMAIRYKD